MQYLIRQSLYPPQHRRDFEPRPGGDFHERALDHVGGQLEVLRRQDVMNRLGQDVATFVPGSSTAMQLRHLILLGFPQPRV